MHRSGASSVARSIALCAASDNVVGFREPSAIITVNDQAFVAACSGWDDVLEINRSWFKSETATRLRDQLSKAITRGYADAAQFVVNDPRMCRLLPLWLPVLEQLGIKPRIVIPLRHPLEVAASLATREKLETNHSLMLWLRNLLDAEHASRNIPRHFLTYDIFLADPVQSLTQLGARLGLSWQRQPVAATADLADILSHNQHHHKVVIHDANPPLVANPNVSAAWDLACAVAGGHVDNAPSLFDAIATRISASEIVFGPTIRGLQNALAETRRAHAMEVRRLAQEKANLVTQYEAFVRSNSWRVTRPLRIAKALAKRNPAYVEQLGNLPGMRLAAYPFTWPRRQLGRAQHLAGLIHQLSQNVGGTSRLMRRGIQILRQQGLSGLRSKLRQLEAGNAPSSLLARADAEATARALFAQQQSELSVALARTMQDSFAVQPLISVIMPIYKTPIQWLQRAILSLQCQYYDRWELCAVDDCSPDNAQRTLLQELAASDTRVRFRVMARNGGISAASNAALDMARGEYVALLDHDDELTPDALFRVVEKINRYPDADFLYSDECKLDEKRGRRLFQFVFKPDWSPEFMFNAMLTGHLTVYRKELVETVGGFRSRYDFSQDYDLALRAAEAAKRIVHIERLLYLWRSIPGSAASGGKGFARKTNIAALNDALYRQGIPGEVIPLPDSNYVRITLPAEPPLVSIIIPSDSAENLRVVLRSLWGNTDYANLEVVVVCNGPLADRLMGEISGRPALRFVKYDKQYNFSDKCNAGAEAARGRVVVFYNDDVFPLQRDWVERLIEYLWVPGVGGVSPKLLHADDTIQYAGMISGTPGLCGTAYNGVPTDARDPFLTMHRFVRNVSILSGACCALRRDVFWDVGGFDAVHTPHGHSDMDLSYKLIETGYRCVYTPHALLRHIGNHSWRANSDKYKADIYALKRWGALLSRDPYFTDSMKRVLYHDFRFDYRIYAEHLDPQEHYAGPDILFIAHELTLTGAPRMLFYAATVVRKNGGFPVVVAPADGPMRKELIRAGIVVIIDESILHNHFLFERFARNFDLAVVNTVALKDVVRQLSAIPLLRTLWWLHEAQSLSVHLENLPDVEWGRVCALCVSDYARAFVPPGIEVKVLHNGIPDQPLPTASRDPTTLMTFVLAGTIEPRKGQDLLVEAVSLLPPAIRRRCRFLLTGKLWDGNRGFWRSLEAKIRSLSEIEYLGLLDHQSQLHLIASADIVVCCSRDDPAPLVVLEAAMLSKPVILSNRVGLLDVMDGDSSLVFEPENAASLAEQLCAAYEKRIYLPEMGMAARRRFEQELTLEIFTHRFMALVSAQIASGESETDKSEASGQTPDIGADRRDRSVRVLSTRGAAS